jgi:hypothetical protein
LQSAPTNQSQRHPDADNDEHFHKNVQGSGKSKTSSAFIPELPITYPNPPPPRNLNHARNELNCYVSGKYGHRYIPGKVSSLFGGFFIVGFGIFWTAMAASITNFGGVGIFSIFPFFGILFILFGAGMSMSCLENQAGCCHNCASEKKVYMHLRGFSEKVLDSQVRMTQAIEEFYKCSANLRIGLRAKNRWWISPHSDAKFVCNRAQSLDPLSAYCEMLDALSLHFVRGFDSTIAS